MENKKSLIALALVALVGIVGGTFAYFTSSTTLTNEFETGTYSTSVTEEFVSPSNWTPGTTTQKKVNVTNNGNVEVAVRATYRESWTAADGTELTGLRDYKSVAQFEIGPDWELAKDGYYYYKGTLTNGQTSSDFISSVTFNPNFELLEGTDIECTTTETATGSTNSCTSLTSGYAGATYILEITIETIQADQKWSYTVVPLITFTIDGVSYQALEGMTWAEWYNSSYNTTTNIIIAKTLHPSGTEEIEYVWVDKVNTSAYELNRLYSGAQATQAVDVIKRGVNYTKGFNESVATD